MTERQWFLGNIGGISLFGTFLLLSFLTFGNRVIILMTETIGFLTLTLAGITLYYIRNHKKWLMISIIAFLTPWLIFSIGYEIGITESTNSYWIWFVLFYLGTIAAFVLMKKSYLKIEGLYKLFPVFFIFFNSMLFIYMAVLNFWWFLPV
ncbi:hypothetical protein [Halobacillus sp. Marseille-Q1614]|uniref:hypothetical protein n=1 Tax=Halobacillus sp. Marseille-Q1614 TaxID=2709134 RepID=UPI001570693B|nr:hypothetical protein [Halobacillus sp. Marseille-Q1614]